MRSADQKFVLWGSASLLALALTVPALAQDATETPEATAVDGLQTEEIEADDEVIVTARRREERLQDVPLALSVLNSDALAQKGITELAEVGSKVPGLVVANSLGGGRSTPTFAIRGQSQQELTGIADPSVTLYVNDIAVPRPHGANMAFFDIASIEVAKGPQGTLFGRNTTGGAILVRTKRPTDVFEGYVSQLVGNYGAFTTEAMINVPLGDNAAIRFAGQHMQRDGYMFDAITGDDINHAREDAFRVTLEVEPWENVNSVTTLGYSRANNGGTGGIITFSLNPLFQPGLASQAARDIYTTASGIDMSSRIRNFYIDNQTTIDINENWSIKNIIGYREIDVHSMEDLDATSDILFPVERIVDQHQISEELQLQGTFEDFDFILGGFYFQEESSDQALTTGALSGTGQTDPGLIEPDSISVYFPRYSNTWVKPKNTSYAVFFQGNYRFDDQWSVTAGIRQNWDTREVTTLNRAFIPAVSTAGQSCRFTLDLDNNPATPETRPPLSNCIFQGEQDFDELTYNISLQFQPQEDVLIYLAHRHGYRSGGFSARGNSQATLSDVFEPELVDDYELGIKADWNFNDMFLRTNIAAYIANYSDLQRILSQGLAPPVTVTTNAGQARIQGFEFDFLFRPSEMFEFSGSYAYTDADFETFIGPNGDDFSNQIFPRAPKNTYSITGTFIPPVGDGVGDIRFSVTYLHQDAYDYSDDYALEVTQAGVPIPAGVAYNRAQIIEEQNLVNISFDWQGVMGSQFDLSAYVNNATDEEYLVPYMGVVSVYDARAAGAPLSYGVTLRRRF